MHAPALQKREGEARADFGTTNNSAAAFDFRQVGLVRRNCWNSYRENRLISGLRQARELNTYQRRGFGGPSVTSNFPRFFVLQIPTNHLPVVIGTFVAPSLPKIYNR